MPTKIRVNLAHALELQELPGIGPKQARAIVRAHNAQRRQKDSGSMGMDLQESGATSLA